MITGFNTDIEHEGVTYHVQTEDKGRQTPLILSLVYDRGTILASKRSPYDDLLEAGFDEKVLTERLQKQHKTICAAVRAGRIEDLKRMTAKEAAAKQEIPKPDAALGAEPETTIAEAAAEIAPAKKAKAGDSRPRQGDSRSKTPPFYRPAGTGKRGPETLTRPAPRLRIYAPEGSQKLAEKIDQAKALEAAQPAPAIGGSAIPKPQQALIWEAPAKNGGDGGGVLVEAIEIIEEEPIIEEVHVLSEFAKTGRHNGGNKLRVEFSAETVFKSGERKTVSLFVHRGDRSQGIGEAQVMIKVLGSNFRPLIFHAKTDDQGVAVAHLQLPHFRAGRAAILVRALSEGEEAELRQVIVHG